MCQLNMGKLLDPAAQQQWNDMGLKEQPFPNCLEATLAGTQTRDQETASGAWEEKNDWMQVIVKGEAYI